MHHHNTQLNPADLIAAVGPPSAHPIAADGVSTAAAQAPQLGQGSPAAKPAMQSSGSAAVPQGIELTVQGTPADITGIAASHAHNDEEDMQGGAVATAQLTMQSEEKTDQTAVDVQHVQNPAYVQALPRVVESEPVRGLADPNKRLLAKMGSHAPSDVSTQLLQEVAARSHVQGLLQVCRPFPPPLPFVLSCCADGLVNIQTRGT